MIEPHPAELQQLWHAVVDGSAADASDPGRVACAFVALATLRLAGKRWLQGPRRPPLTCDRPEPEVQLLAQRLVYRVEAKVAHTLVEWAHGRRALVALRRVPTAREVLAWQARGMRCVSLLPDGADTGLQPSPLEFALHDLCHAEKFFDPEHHRGQVGWSIALQTALASDDWRRLTQGWDDAWPSELDHVTADMNGSPLFLFSALRRKVELAAGRVGQDPQRTRESLLDVLGMAGPVREAAATFSIHRDVDPAVVARNASLLLQFFQSFADPAPECQALLPA